MSEESDLYILAKMSQGSPNEDDAFTIRDANGSVLTVIHSLAELLEALSNLSPEQIFPSLCRTTNEEFECDIALWVHYVLGDAVLSAKIYNLVQEFRNTHEKLKLEIFNLCFNRYINFQELIEYSDDFSMFGNEAPPSDL